MSLSMNAEVQASTLRLILEGELTRVDTAPFKEWATQQIEEHTPERVEVVCRDLNYLDSAGLGSLIYVRKIVGDQQVPFLLVEVGGWLKKFLQVTGLEKAFTSEPEVEKQN